MALRSGQSRLAAMLLQASQTLSLHSAAPTCIGVTQLVSLQSFACAPAIFPCTTAAGLAGACLLTTAAAPVLMHAAASERPEALAGQTFTTELLCAMQACRHKAVGLHSRRWRLSFPLMRKWRLWGTIHVERAPSP